MGLFDNIHVKKKLPSNSLLKQFLGKDFDLSKLEYQTKDLENAMLHYEIRANGDLYYEEVKYRETTPEEKEIERKQALKEKNKWLRPFSLRVESTRWVKTDITRTINFYAYFKHTDGRYYSIDYVTTVVKGKVKNIKLDKTERETDQEYSDRLAVEAKWAEEMRLHQAKVKSLSYKVLNNIYNKPVRAVLRFANRTSQNLPSLFHKLERKLLY